jgi:CheY-like chemotaxis protein
MAVNVAVLLVDDNPTILAMLQQALASPVATITTLTDGADALLRVIDEPFDLVVSDYQMPGMDGRQLLQKIKARPATARIPVVLLASKGDIAEKLRVPLQDSVEDFIEKPFFLRDAARRIKRIIDKIALEKMAHEAPAADGVLRGTLAQMNVVDLLQSLEQGRKSCLLSLTRGGERCDLYFSEGQILHGSYGAVRGDEAVLQVVAWQEGNFQIDFRKQSKEQTTSMSTQALLMEGLRRLDEATRDLEEGTQAPRSGVSPRDVLSEEDNVLES